jgi:nucleoside-diphosphate-sugar epimerase
MGLFMQVLITGGAGYLGSIMTERLLSAWHSVTVVDSLLYQQNSLFQFCANPRFEFVAGDARDEELMRRLIKDADVIIPLAAVVGAPACDRDPWLARSVNVDAVQMIKRLRSPDQLIIYPNTNSGYGTQTGGGICTEETPMEPISVYGQTKVEAELEVLDAVNTLTLRLATVFGTSPRMRLDLLVNHFTHEAVTSGYIVIFEKDFKRNYIHIRDVADCFVHCIDNADKMVGRPYNLGLDDANLSKEQLAVKIQQYVPNFYLHFSEIGSDPDKRDYIVSNQRLKEAGFEAKRTLDEGIPELLKAYRMMGRAQFGNI